MIERCHHRHGRKRSTGSGRRLRLFGSFAGVVELPARRHGGILIEGSLDYMFLADPLRSSLYREENKLLSHLHLLRYDSTCK